MPAIQRKRSVRIGGVSRVVNKLDKVETAMKRATIRALEEGGKLVQADAKRNVRVDTGELRDNIIVKTFGKDVNKQFVRVIADRPYGHLVEFGTDPHEQPKLGRPHPGARENPFLFPALEANREKIVRLARVALRRAIVRSI